MANLRTSIIAVQSDPAFRWVGVIESSVEKLIASLELLGIPYANQGVFVFARCELEQLQFLRQCAEGTQQAYYDATTTV